MAALDPDMAAPTSGGIVAAVSIAFYSQQSLPAATYPKDWDQIDAGGANL